MKKNQPPQRSGAARISLLPGLLLVAATLLAYYPAWNGKPLWDDDAHITRPELRSLGGLVRIWTEPGATQQYYPLVHSVFWAGHALWGDATFPWHWLNILLHAASAILLWKILRELEVPGAWLAAGIFALHPIEVESVAWISELKNTLSGVFFFAAILFYIRFDRSQRTRLYIFALVAFLPGLMCKTVIASLPGVLLVLLWWRRGKLSLKRDVLPLAPFFAAGLVAGLFTAWVEQRFIGAQGAAFHFTLIERFLIAGRAFWFYLSKIFCPVNLIFIYPRWHIHAAAWWQYGFPLAALILLSTLVAIRRRTRAPLAAALLFGGMLFPALGFLNVYPFIYSFVADHFQYLAAAAVFALLAAGIVWLFDYFRLGQISRRTIGFFLLAGLGTLTWRQSAVYADGETLYRDILKKNPVCWMALNNIGIELVPKGRAQDAIDLCRRTLSVQPDYAEAEVTIGNVLLKTHRPAEAIDHFNQALALKFEQEKAGRAKAEYFLGNAWLEKGDRAEAVRHYTQSLQFQSEYTADAHNNLGDALLSQGEVDDAIAHYRAAIKARSLLSRAERAKAEYNLANALNIKGETNQAISCLEQALQLRPNYPEAHNNLGRILIRQRKFTEGIAHYRKALELVPQSVLFQNNLAWQMAACPEAALRQGSQAVALASEANRLSGEKNPAILNTLAAAYAENGQFAEATETARKALRLADAAGDTGLSEVLRRGIALYSAGRTYQEP